MFRKILSNQSIRQFIQYFFVGGVSSVVEWVLFHIFANVCDIQYLLATVCAVIFSTTVNWLLGRFFVFKDNKRFDSKPAQEAAVIFLVAFVGLLFNLGLMWVFVSVLGLDSGFLKVASKMTATAIVFGYNFLVRKFIIYR